MYSCEKCHGIFNDCKLSELSFISHLKDSTTSRMMSLHTMLKQFLAMDSEGGREWCFLNLHFHFLLQLGFLERFILKHESSPAFLANELQQVHYLNLNMSKLPLPEMDSSMMMLYHTFLWMGPCKPFWAGHLWKIS